MATSKAIAVYSSEVSQDNLSVTIVLFNGKMHITSNGDLRLVKRALRTALTVATRALKEKAG